MSVERATGLISVIGVAVEATCVEIVKRGKGVCILVALWRRKPLAPLATVTMKIDMLVVAAVGDIITKSGMTDILSVTPAKITIPVHQSAMDVLTGMMIAIVVKAPSATMMRGDMTGAIKTDTIIMIVMDISEAQVQKVDTREVQDSSRELHQVDTHQIEKEARAAITHPPGRALHLTLPNSTPLLNAAVLGIIPTPLIVLRMQGSCEHVAFV